VTLQELFLQVPLAIGEMHREFFRVGGEHFDRSMTSQYTACFMLGIRSVSLLSAMGKALHAGSFDSYDVLQRAFLETRDLLTTFRFDQDETRKRIKVWFRNNDKDSWKAQHGVCERFLKSVGAGNVQLAKKWGMFSALSHPTYRATCNSVAVRGASMSLPKRLELIEVLDEKVADYITATLTLFIVMSFELEGWVHLGCDGSRMPIAEALRTSAPPVVLPLLSRTENRKQPKPSKS
jgi:hypothetical protein